MKSRILFIAIASLFLAACSTKEDNTQKEKFQDAFTQKVKTVKAELSNRNADLTLNGKVEYNPDKVMNYIPLVSGVVTRTYFSLGDKVKRGQVLLDIRSSDLSELQSNLVELEGEIAITKREQQAAEAMFEDNMISERELLEAKAKVRQAEAALNKNKSDMSVFGSNKGSGVFAVTAPMDGYVVAKDVSSGSTISADGDALFTIADLSTVWINANVYATNLQMVKEEMDVQISLLSYPNEKFNGKINHLSQVFDSEEKVLKARINMDNKDLKFKPEMSAVIHVTDANYPLCIAVPSDALIFDADRYFLIVQKSEKEYEIRQVVLQGHHQKTSYLVSGITEGENIVVKNQLLIYSELKEL